MSSDDIYTFTDEEEEEEQGVKRKARKVPLELISGDNNVNVPKGKKELKKDFEKYKIQRKGIVKAYFPFLKDDQVNMMLKKKWKENQEQIENVNRPNIDRRKVNKGKDKLAKVNSEKSEIKKEIHKKEIHKKERVKKTIQIDQEKISVTDLILATND